MRKVSFWMAAGLAAVSVLMLAGCDKLKSRDDINQGIQAFRSAKYSVAIEKFKEAIALDPDNPNARLYLATSYMQQWIPGAESPENVELGRKAQEGFQSVLEKNPNDTTALASLASIAYNSASSLPPEQKAAKFDEAAKWQKKVAEVDPKNKDAYYWLGVIAWAKWYPALMTARANLRMRAEDPGPIKDKKVKEELRAQYLPMVDDGIANLNRALEIDKEYEDAMSYLNLLIRERADLLDNPDEYKKQIEIADGWVQKALDTKKAKALRAPASGGITAEPVK
jgi:tetratricopeptide (TPR) repeat protein